MLTLKRKRKRKKSSSKIKKRIPKARNPPIKKVQPIKCRPNDSCSNQIIQRLQQHKIKFDIDFENNIYDITPQEADIYYDSIDDAIEIIKRMRW